MPDDNDYYGIIGEISRGVYAFHPLRQQLIPSAKYRKDFKNQTFLKRRSISL